MKLRDSRVVGKWKVFYVIRNPSAKECFNIQGHYVFILFPVFYRFFAEVKNKNLLPIGKNCLSIRWRARWCITSLSHRSRISIICTSFKY